MTAPPRILTLAGGEPILRYGSNNGLQLLVLQPLFEEMNRCRAFVATLCRSLSARGFGCWLPDLPGCGESVRPLKAIAWEDWTAAIDDALALITRETDAAPFATIGIRGGALLDMGAAKRWRLSPVGGDSLLTDLRRAGLLAAGAYAPSDALAASLATVEPEGAARIIRLVGDDRPCDRTIDGPALWRRPEPANSPGLAERLAEDIAAWSSA